MKEEKRGQHDYLDLLVLILTEHERKLDRLVERLDEVLTNQKSRKVAISQ